MSINITEEFVRNLIEQNAALIAQVANLSERDCFKFCVNTKN